MFRKLAGGLAALMLVVAGGLAVSATPSLAQAVFRDDAPATGGLEGVNALTGFVRVSAPYTVTSIEALNRVSIANNQKFVILNMTTNRPVYISPPKSFAADGADATFKASDLFPAVTLQPGNNYYVGAIADVSAYYPYRSPGAAVTQGVVTNSFEGRNGGLADYAAPTGLMDGTASVPIRLNTVGAAVAVPTMTEWAMILFGVVLAGGAAVVIQRRRLAA